MYMRGDVPTCCVNLNGSRARAVMRTVDRSDHVLCPALTHRSSLPVQNFSFPSRPNLSLDTLHRLKASGGDTTSKVKLPAMGTPSGRLTAGNARKPAVDVNDGVRTCLCQTARGLRVAAFDRVAQSNLMVSLATALCPTSPNSIRLALRSLLA